MVKQADIAKKLNISRTTVARALAGRNVSPKTRQQVLRLAKEMGYVHNSAASSLPAQGRKLVCAFLIATIDEGYSSEMEAGIREVNRIWNGYNFEVRVFFTDICRKGDQCTEQMDLFYKVLAQEPADGVIFSALCQDNLKRATEYCGEKDIPLMTLDLIAKDAGLCHIGVDYHTMGVQSASLLAGMMRREGELLILNYDDGYGLSRVRMEGFSQRMADFVHVRKREVYLPDIGYESYRQILARELKRMKPNAIYAPYKMDHVVRALDEFGWPHDCVMISNGINDNIERYLFDDRIVSIVSARPYYCGAIAANNFFRYFFRPMEMQRGEILIPCDIYMKENYTGFRNVF